MAALFDYKTLNVTLEKETRSLVATLTRNKNNNCINHEIVADLESLLGWAASHIEINSILIRSNTDFFSLGADELEISKMNIESLSKFFERIQRLVYGMLFLPQTIIFDLGSGACGVAAELALGADIRIGKNNCQIHFNQTQKGYTPMCGGVGFLSALLGNSIARNFLLCARPIGPETLLQSGYLHETYNYEEEVGQLLVAIKSQAPVQRIQAKRSLLEAVMPSIDRALIFEKEFGLAGLLNEDYKNSDFQNSRETAHRAQEEERIRNQVAN